MQYWTQTEATEAFADWLQHNVDMIPEGQDLRQHFHVVMQIADTTAEDGMTDLCQSREIYASRMANQRDKQALYETYKERMHKDVNNEAASRWQTKAQRPMKVPDSPDIQATRNGHKQSRKPATARLHRTGNPLPSLHTSTKMHGKIQKKPRCAGRLLQGENKTKNRVHHDRNEAGTQHNKTNSTASCKLAIRAHVAAVHSGHAHQPGSIQACFANAAAKENAAKQQPATLLSSQKCTCNTKR